MSENQILNMILAKLEKLEKEKLPELLSHEETANYLKIHKNSLTNLMTEPDFPRVIKVGRQNRFKKQDIANYINAQANH